MAEPLSVERTTESNLTQATFLEFVDKIGDAEKERDDAKETVRSLNRRVKDLRKTAKKNGVDLDEMDWAIREAGKSESERMAGFKTRAQYLAYLETPINHQWVMFEHNPTPPDKEAVNVHTLKAVDNDGFAAGLAGDRADSNPHTPGEEAYQRWANAWQRGQAAKVARDIPPTRPRGRPRKEASAEKPKRARAKSKNGEAPTEPAPPISDGDTALPLTGTEESGLLH